MTWGQQNTEAEAHEQLSYALDQGVNFIDTAEASHWSHRNLLRCLPFPKRELLSNN